MSKLEMVALYMLKILFGIASMNALPTLLFSNVAAMTLVGFNAYQVRHGFTRRGDHARRKKAKQGPLSPQCVVRMWNNRVLEDGGHVYLTNGTVEDAFAVFDTYDGRSLIENGLFREGKGPWVLEHAPQKNENAVIVHVVFTVTVMALATAYRIWSCQQALAEEESPVSGIALLAGEGTTAWRRRLLQENRDKVIVFVGDHYGIFHAMFAILAGLHIKLKGIPPELGSPADILARYGLP